MQRSLKINKRVKQASCTHGACTTKRQRSSGHLKSHN